jgi:hypothetical protein
MLRDHHFIKIICLSGFMAITECVGHAQLSIPITGVANTIAGDGVNGTSGDGGQASNAELTGPSAVAVDASGNVYIDAGSIRKIDATTGIITTVAGISGVAGYSGDGGPAASAELSTTNGVAVDKSGNIYIADTGNNRIRKVTASTGIITTIAGNGAQGYAGDGGAATSADCIFRMDWR